MSVILPTFAGGGTHVNLSGVVLARHAPHKDNAVKLIEWLVGEHAQHMYADMNYEYPLLSEIKVNPTIAATARSRPTRCRLRKSPRTRRARRTWSTRWGSITDELVMRGR